MMVNIMTDGLPVPVNQALVAILQQHITEALSNTDDAAGVDAITLNFRDPDYSAEAGGYHPVEIRLTYQQGQWHLNYITDFSYVGSGWDTELAKDMDFDFGLGVCMTRFMPDSPLADAAELYQLFETNFIAYYQMDAYKVDTTLEQ